MRHLVLVVAAFFGSVLGGSCFEHSPLPPHSIAGSEPSQAVTDPTCHAPMVALFISPTVA
jgi:hypothetical protein